MIDVAEDRLKQDLNRLAYALVPNLATDQWPVDSQGIPLASERTISEIEIVAVRSHPLQVSRSRRLGVSAAAIVLAICGVGLLLTRQSNDSVGSPPSSANGCDDCASQAGPLWADGVGMIVYVENGATAAEVAAIQQSLLDAADVVDAARLQYLDEQQSLDEALKLFADDPDTLALLTSENVPSMFKVFPVQGREALLAEIATSINQLSAVSQISFPPEPGSVPGRDLSSIDSIDPGTIPDETVEGG
jgi:hypothetical protein